MVCMNRLLIQGILQSFFNLPNYILYVNTRVFCMCVCMLLDNIWGVGVCGQYSWGRCVDSFLGVYVFDIICVYTVFGV